VRCNLSHSLVSATTGHIERSVRNSFSIATGNVQRHGCRTNAIAPNKLKQIYSPHSPAPSFRSICGTALVHQFLFPLPESVDTGGYNNSIDRGHGILLALLFIGRPAYFIYPLDVFNASPNTSLLFMSIPSVFRPQLKVLELASSVHNYR